MLRSRKERVLAGLAGILILAFVSWYLLQKNDSAPLEGGASLNDTEILLQPTDTNDSREKPEKAADPVVIDIKGEVRHPGVYHLLEGDRVEDAVNKAGGFTSEADWTQVNLASKAVDGMMIIIPKAGEQPGAGAVSSGAESSGKVNINRATLEQLQKIPGIGPAKANAIFEYREKNGPFKTPEALLEVSGIGEKSLEKMAGHFQVP